MNDLERFPYTELSYFCPSASQYSRSKKPLILAVDDDEDNLLLLAYALEPLDCNLLTATDGRTAFQKAQAQRPDLILLDIRLPYMDGTEVVSQLRKDSKTKTIPVIAVTALAGLDDRESLLQVGCDDYISKPYLIEDMEALVRRFLRLPIAIS
jgi:two-component system cell cycle response regulator DivK